MQTTNFSFLWEFESLKYSLDYRRSFPDLGSFILGNDILPDNHRIKRIRFAQERESSVAKNSYFSSRGPWFCSQH